MKKNFDTTYVDLYRNNELITDMTYYINKFISNFNLETFVNTPYTTPLQFNIFFINLLILVSLVGFISFCLPKNPKSISVLNTFIAFILILYIITIPIQHYIPHINIYFGISLTPIIYFFIICSGIQLISFLLINNKITFTKDNIQIEYPLLLLFLFLSAIILIAALNWIIILISLEAITFIVAVLVAFERNHYFTSSIAIRYILFSAIPSGILILGIIEFYIYCGSFNLFDISKFYLFTDFNIILTENKQFLINKKIYLSLFTDVFKYQSYLALENQLNTYYLYVNIFYLNKYNINLNFNSYYFKYNLHLNYDFFNFKVENINLIECKLYCMYYEEFCQEIVWDLVENYFNFINNNLLELFQFTEKSIIIVIALFMIIFNILFKLTAAPFHFWAPLIYEGAPLGVSMVLSIFTKITMIFFLIKVILILYPLIDFNWTNLLLFSGLLSIIMGIYGAISETKIKRFFVYSSMGHVGFMLLGLSTGTLHGISASLIYLIIYIFSAFIGWLILFSSNKKIIYLNQLSGLSKNNFFISLILSLNVLSMSGIPPLAGFYVKYDILFELIQSEYYIIAFITLLLSVISFFYYLRIIKILYFDNNNLSYKLQFKLWENQIQSFILSCFIFILIGFPLYIDISFYFIIKILFLN